MHYIGECARCWYAVTIARYEAEVSTEKRSTAFWKRQFDQAENGRHMERP